MNAKTLEGMTATGAATGAATVDPIDATPTPTPLPTPTTSPPPTPPATAATRATTPTPAPVPSPPLRIGWRRADGPAALVAREWLLTNGLGGYASGTLGGAPTRRYHGLLVAALPAPLGRTMMLNHIVEMLRLDGGGALAGDLAPAGPLIPLTGLEPHPGPLALPDALVEVRFENGRPVWRFERDGVVLERSILIPYRQNTVHVTYRLLAAPAPLTLLLDPALDIRSHDGSVSGGSPDYGVEETPDGLAIAPLAPEGLAPPGHAPLTSQARALLPPLRLALRARHAFRFERRPRELGILYRVEQSRGYESAGKLHLPGTLEVPLAPGDGVVLVASTESWETMRALSAADARRLDDDRRTKLLARARPALRTGPAAELVLAADQFIITPHTRPGDEARQHAEGDDARTVIAGYPWFTDWGRDTMISLEGLTLLTGREAEARAILYTFAHHVRDGLIPNMFPEGESEGLYHTADATLWFFHALDRYQRATGDHEAVRVLLPKLVDIVLHHVRGTRFGIGVDPADGLLRQGADGYQLTWMDAKVGDWVVTPRRGKAVEINALFYNALRLLEGWLRDEPAAGNLPLRADEAAACAAAVHQAFNRRFWYAEGGYLYDVVDGDGDPGAGGAVDDASLRPNQVLAIALAHPVLERARWEPVMRAVREQLVTPFGLRSLAPGHPDYKQRYDGDLRARDAAYHQGTVWGWLMGPFVDAWFKTFPDDVAGAHPLLDGLGTELANSCVGTLSEIFDAEPPFTPRGCVAQAWSVAEALRTLNSEP